MPCGLWLLLAAALKSPDPEASEAGNPQHCIGGHAANSSPLRSLKTSCRQNTKQTAHVPRQQRMPTWKAGSSYLGRPGAAQHSPSITQSMKPSRHIKLRQKSRQKFSVLTKAASHLCARRILYQRTILTTHIIIIIYILHSTYTTGATMSNNAY